MALFLSTCGMPAMPGLKQLARLPGPCPCRAITVVGETKPLVILFKLLKCGKGYDGGSPGCGVDR